jgi:hypothetical protein
LPSFVYYAAWISFKTAVLHFRDNRIGCLSSDLLEGVALLQLGTPFLGQASLASSHILDLDVAQGVITEVGMNGSLPPPPPRAQIPVIIVPDIA